jgi:hypothetical protein
LKEEKMKEEQRKGTNKGLRVSEHCAEYCGENEAEWLMKWSREAGREKLFGEIIGTPCLVLDHVAGRVYSVKTKLGKSYYVVVGHGNPFYYPAKVELTEPKEILSYHRGNKLLANLKINHSFRRR